MPMPMPHDGESHDDFHSRCMADETMRGDFPENDQRNAVCQKQWDKGPMMSSQKKPSWLAVSAKGAMGVDRTANVIRGVILAEEGAFKDGRGEFDRAAIRQVVKLGKDKPSGLKARFRHPTLSDDGLGKFLGRHKNLRSDTVMRQAGKDADGKPLMKEMLVARGDLHLDKTALEEPPGGGKPLGTYVMDLADSDPDALGLSLVLKSDQTTRVDSKSRPLTDAAGEQLPPLWMPTELHACDCVDDGDATHSFLSAEILEGLPDALVRQGCELLDRQFDGKPREFIESRLTAFVGRYLNWRFGEPEEEAVETKTEIAAAPEPDESLSLELYLVENE